MEKNWSNSEMRKFLDAFTESILKDAINLIIYESDLKSINECLKQTDKSEPKKYFRLVEYNPDEPVVYTYPKKSNQQTPSCALKTVASRLRKIGADDYDAETTYSSSSTKPKEFKAAFGDGKQRFIATTPISERIKQEYIVAKGNGFPQFMPYSPKYLEPYLGSDYLPMMCNGDKKNYIERNKKMSNNKTDSEKVYAAIKANPEITNVLTTSDQEIHAFSINKGVVDNACVVMPAISDVKVYADKDGCYRSVVMIFADGTRTKAVLSKKDRWDLETGISICIMKKILGKITNCDGNAIYNKLVSYGLKSLKKSDKRAGKIASEKAKQKAAEKAKADKIEKKKAARREEQIEIQAEAYRRAMKDN